MSPQPPLQHNPPQPQSPQNRPRSLHSQALDLLRFPLAVVVVLVHTFPLDTGFNIMGRPFDFADYPIFWEVLNFIRAFIRGQSVPIYYFISGYVFFLGVAEFTREKYVQKLKNRVKTLVIPYFIWNAVSLAVLFATHMDIFRRYLTNPGEAFNPTFAAIVSSFWSSAALLPAEASALPANGPLWFVRNLIIVVLCTPLLWQMLRRLRGWAVAVFGVLWFALEIFPEYNFWNLSTSFFFFSFGACMSIFKRDMIVEFGRIFTLSAILYPVLGVLCIVSLHCCPAAVGVIKQLNILAGLVFAYNVSVRLLRNGRCSVNPLLSASSFFIYVSHAIVCGKVRTLLLILFSPSSELGLIMVYVLSLTVTVLSLLAVYAAMRRYTPLLLSVLTGRK